MLLNEIKDLIISPTLSIVGLGGDDADMLLLCTGMQETRYIHLQQIKGPALGPWQVEPRTHGDIKKWLSFRDNKLLCERITSACYMPYLPTTDDVLIWNWRYSVLMARLVYRRAKPPLPSCKDVDQMAQYYCKYYNAGGKAELLKVIKVFEDVVNGFNT